MSMAYSEIILNICSDWQSESGSLEYLSDRLGEGSTPLIQDEHEECWEDAAGRTFPGRLKHHACNSLAVVFTALPSRSLVG